MARCIVLIAIMRMGGDVRGEELQDPLFEPTISLAHFQNILAQMHLTNDEAALVQSAYQRLTTEFAKDVSKTRRQYAGLETGAVDHSTWTKTYHQWLLRRQLLEKEFEDSILAIVDEPSAAAWLVAVSDIHRRFVLQELHGRQNQRFACDLLTLLDSIDGLDRQREPLALLMTSYREAMDQRIREFERQRAPLSLAIIEHRDGLKL